MSKEELSQDPGEALVMGRTGDCTPHASGEEPQDQVSDCAFVCESLRHLLVVELGTKDVVTDFGAEVLLSLVESPVEGAPFKTSCAILQDMTSYRPFAQVRRRKIPRRSNLFIYF